MKAGRIIVAGLLAGLVMNIGEYVLNGILLREDHEAAMANLGFPPLSGGDIGVLVVMTFLTGIALIWLYAAIRPRFGPGPKTAIIAGFFGWVLLYVWPFVWNSLVPLWPSRPMMIGAVWALFEIPIATLVGAWLYKEEPTAARSTI